MARPLHKTAAAAHGATTPALTVAAVIERDGHYLMVEEWFRGRRVLNQPAGHVEAGESLASAVVRETMEETAWVFAPETITGVYLWQRPGSARGFLRVAIRGQVLAQESDRALDEGIIQAVWLTREQLLQRSECLRSPMVMRAIDDHLAGARQPLGPLNELTPALLMEHAQRL